MLAALEIAWRPRFAGFETHRAVNAVDILRYILILYLIQIKYISKLKLQENNIWIWKNVYTMNVKRNKKRWNHSPFRLVKVCTRMYLIPYQYIDTGLYSVAVFATGVPHSRLAQLSVKWRYKAMTFLLEIGCAELRGLCLCGLEIIAFRSIHIIHAYHICNVYLLLHRYTYPCPGRIRIP